jgi:hypothetical protein
MARQALVNSELAIASLDEHTRVCAKNQNMILFIGKTILVVLGSGTVLLLGGIGAIAYALFEFIIANPHLFSARP